MCEIITSKDADKSDFKDIMTFLIYILKVKNCIKIDNICVGVYHSIIIFKLCI